jgi:ABC-2 type transport system ATP-binding protein
METMITTEGLTRTFGTTIAVDHVSLSVRKGELYGLLGPNGSGKTTMIRMLTGQIRPTEGSARVLGLNPDREPVEVRARVGIIPEQETPPGFLTAEEYLHFAGSVRMIADIEKEADWWFEFLEFSDKRDVLCKDLSRGTRQKLMFSQAFLHRPALALIDEPLINFDPVIQEKVKGYLLDYVGKGVTVFISTHILEIAEEICTSFAILHQGKLIHTGTVRELRERDRHLNEFFLSLVRNKAHV